jgi:hypothetical protein
MEHTPWAVLNEFDLAAATLKWNCARKYTPNVSPFSRPPAINSRPHGCSSTAQSADAIRVTFSSLRSAVVFRLFDCEVGSQPIFQAPKPQTGKLGHNRSMEMEIWKTLRVFHISRPPATTTDTSHLALHERSTFGTKDQVRCFVVPICGARFLAQSS